MGIFLLAVVIGLLPAAIAHRKGHNFVKWWIMGAALFILALPAAIMAKPVNRELERRELDNGDAKKCPHCAEIIRREANVCRYCGRDVYQSQGGAIAPRALAGAPSSVAPSYRFNGGDEG